MYRAMAKAERLREMERLYALRAYSDKELADLFDVDPATIYRARIELEREFPLIRDDDGRHRLDRARNISSIRLNLAEALSLYLAGRRLSQQTRVGQRPVASALEKLAEVLRQPMTRRLLQAAERILQNQQDLARTEIFQTVAQAWSEQRKMRLRYRALRREQELEHHFSPFLLEPSPWNDGVYLIGHSDVVQKVITLRLDRIVSAKLLGTFSLPDDFNEDELLRHAWGIWGSEGEPEVVRLRFVPGQAARRVQESIWHPLQTMTPEADGSVLWEAPIAEWLEMLPWVRGWGADVEVLGPDSLRKEIAREAQRLGALYQAKVQTKQFVAHIREKDKEHQSLQEHLSAVSVLTGQFAQKVGLPETGKLLGLLHDLGKASDKFQRYILSGEGLIDPDAEEYIDPIAHKGKIDHTTAGAQAIYQNLWVKGPKEKIAAQVLALCIASHHSGLIDCLVPDGENNFKRRMEKPDESTRKTEALTNLPEIATVLDGLPLNAVIEQIYAKLISLQQVKGKPEEATVFGFKVGLFIRFLLSCLLDADRLDTADFESPSRARLRNYGQYQSWETLIQRLDRKIEAFEHKPERNAIDALRSQISQSCLDFATKSKDIYQLTVPTGGGKTLASLRFALHHAAQHQMDRVFYVIPYTSIIDQNADEIRKILEDRDGQDHYLDRVVLEHHSNLTPEEESHRQSLLAQNWDAPVVLTTQVQFLEALFGAGTRSPRRMHQLANAVIILDEVQTIPLKTIHMLNVALRFLVEHCGSTVLLCTATQPPLDKIDAQDRALTIQPDKRIIQNERELFERLKRVEVFDERKVGGWSEEEVADLTLRQLQEKGSVLIVVNTKKSARALYQAIAANEVPAEQLYHLSTNMCAVHRLEVLDTIKEKLHKNEPVICVSTQLIEAGVDIDFGAVIRYLAGLDSIAQAAGRCNRHGVRQGLGNVWIVNPKEENIEKLPDIFVGTQHAQRVLDDFKANPARFGNSRIGIKAMAAYYKFYYGQRQNEMKYNVDANSLVGRDDNLFNLLSTNTLSLGEYRRIHDANPDLAFPQSFQTAAKEFHVIDSLTQGVIVPYGKEGEQLVTELCGTPEEERQYKLLKRAQRYSVNLFLHEFRNLANLGVIHEIQPGTGIYYLDERYYSDKFGWRDEPLTNMQPLIV